MAFPTGQANDATYISNTGEMWVLKDSVNNVWKKYTTSDGAQFISATTDQTLTNTEVAQARENLQVGDIGSLAYKNLIINGNMEISQENGNTASNTNGYYPVDMCPLLLNGGHDANVYQESTVVPDNYNNSLAVKVKVANASPNTTSYIIVQQKIEGTHTKYLKWGSSQAQDLTVGFWSYCTTPITFCTAVKSSNDDLAYIKDVTVSTGNTWQWNSFVVPGPTSGTWYSNTSTGMQIYLTLDSGTDYQTSNTENWLSGSYFCSDSITAFGGLGAGNTFYTTGWIAIPGSHTIDEQNAWLLQRQYDDELRKCQRYYELVKVSLQTYMAPSTVATISYNYIEKRVTPTISNYSAGTDSGNVTVFSEGGNPSSTGAFFQIQNTVAAAATRYVVNRVQQINARL